MSYNIMLMLQCTYLPYQSFINILFYFILYNISIFKENMKYIQKFYILYQIKIKFVGYDFKLQWFIIIPKTEILYVTKNVIFF